MRRLLRSFKSRTTAKVIGVAGVLAASTFGIRTWLSASAAEPFTVNTAVVTRGAIVDEVNATGTLQAVTTVQVGSQVSGTIAWLGADYNSVVHKGDVIARLDSRSLESKILQSRASVAQATAQAENAGQELKNAQQKLAQMQSLWDKHLISRNDFDAAGLAVSLATSRQRSAVAQVSQANASLKQDEVALTYATITSPIDGIVIQRSVDVGQTVSTSMSAPTIFAIANDLTDMQVKAGIDESDISRVQPRHPVSFHVDAYPGVTFHGTVVQVRLEPTTVQNVITYAVIIDAPNPDLRLLPGMTANVAIQSAAREDVTRIPTAALRFKPSAAIYAALGQAPVPSKLPDDDTENGITYNGAVWVYTNGKLERVPVQVGIANPQAAELVAGDVSPDMVLVTGVAVGAKTTPVVAAGNIFMSTVPGANGGRQGGNGGAGGAPRQRG